MKMNRMVIITLLVAAFLVAMCETFASAAVIHSNFAVGDTYDYGSFKTVRGSGAGQSDIDHAAPFSVGATGATLTTAEMALRNFNGPNLLTVRLLSDASGAPGTQLASTTVTGMPVSTNVFATAVMTADFTSAALALTPNTTYWLMADTSGSSYVAWHNNAIGEQGNRQRSDGGAWTQFFPSTSGAFRINGTTVPEPASLMLLAMGAIYLLVRRNRY
jgi:PEP-CTERM motif